MGVTYTVVGEGFVFGVNDPLPPRGFPPGRIRWRIRSKECTFARVKTKDGIREFSVKERDGYWEPAFETGRNLTIEGGEA